MENNIFASHKVSILTKLIGSVVPILTLATIAVANASVSISKTTGLTTNFDEDRIDLQNLRTVTIAQDVRAKANDYLKSGTQKFYRQDYRGALADFNLAIQTDPNFVEAYNYRGNLKQNRLKDDRGALADFNRAIQLAPNYALLHRNRGVLKFTRLEDFQGSLADLDRAIQLDPNYAEAYGQRGGLKYEALKDRAGGIADTQQAVKLFKQQGDIKNYNVAIGLLKKWQQTDRKSRR
jgi:tetratricopeptide (TPR) repeat protein